MGFGLSTVLFVLLLRLSTHSYPVYEELYEGSQCKLENGDKGICKKIPDCPSRLREVLEGKRSSDSAGRCGFVDRIEIVCCPYDIADRNERLRPAEIACRQYENDIGTNNDKLRLEDVQFHIWSGTPAGQGEFPYIVALGYENQDRDDDDNPGDVRYSCGGTLISSEHVLTAAHCVSNVQEKVPIEVRIGSEDLRSDNAQRIPVSDVIPHPWYKRSANYHDVAILKLRAPVRMGNNVKPICIQTKSLTSMDMSANVSFIVIGWGITNFDEGPSNKLMKTPGLSLVDRESCAKSFNDFNKLPRGLDESMLCALDTNETRRADACQGDSGGPLLMLAGPSHSVVGITAFGQTCGGPVPGVYTAVYSYLEWIERQETIVRFLDTPEEMILTIQFSPAGALIPFLEIPVAARTKTSYFVKRRPVEITRENYRDVVMPGDMAPKPIEELSVLVEEAYVPILSNPKNHKGWPCVVGEDVKKHVYNLRGVICQLRGKMTGQTLLPMPMGVERIFDEELKTQQSGGTEVDIRLRRDIEAIVMKWCTQIGDTLHEESTRVFLIDKHPQPSAEIEFWRQRLVNVESIYNQMRDPRVKKMASILELTKSPYSACFKTLLRNVIAAVIEARDVCSYLKALEPHFEDIKNTGFKDIQMKLKPLLHCVCLLWSNSKYYCTSTRIITLLVEISNLLISEAAKYLDQNTLFADDVGDSLTRLEHVINVLTYYVEMFETFRTKLDTYFKPPSEPILWNFHDELIFGGITDFQKRLGEIKILFETAREYFKLERMELAGLKGRTLCSRIYDIHEKFVRIYNEFAELEYDILAAEDTRFTDHVTSFLAKMEEFDRELASIFDRAFSECHNTEIMFKLMWIIGSMGNRPIVMAQLWHNYEKLLQRIHERFDDIKVIFDGAFKDHDEIERGHFPPVASALCMLRQLRQRIDYPMQSVKLLDHPLVNLKIARDIKPKYDQLQSLLDAMEHEIFTNWADKVPDTSNTHLSKSLLTIRDNQLLDVNFDPELTAILRETRYMIIMKRTDLPEEAIQLYYKTQYFFESTYNLSSIVQRYNWIRTYTSSVEFELVRREIEKVDELIRVGQETYDWSSPEVPEYIGNLLALVRKLHSRIFRAQGNIAALMRMIYSWALSPILQRKDLKDENLLAVAERDEAFQKRYDKILQAVRELSRVLNENYKLLFDLLPDSMYEGDELDEVTLEILEEQDNAEKRPLAEKSRIEEEKERVGKDDTEISLLTSEQVAQIKWRPYLAYVDDSISKALIQAVSSSICYLLDETDPESNVSPLFEIQLSLQPPNILFHPAVDPDDPEGFYAFFESLLLDMMRMGTLMPRVNPDVATEHYGHDLAEEEGIVFMLEETCNRIKLGLVQAQEYIITFDKFAWLWLDDKQEYLNLFLRFGRALTDKEKAMVAEDSEHLRERKPQLCDFKREIDYFVELYGKCNALENETVFLRWLRLDMRAFKQALLNIICKWTNTFKTYLIDRVNSELGNLNEFLTKALKKFMQPVAADDYEDLLDTIYYLKEVRDRQYQIDDMWEPIKATIDLLRQYQVQFDEETYVWLAELPEQWATVKKWAAQVKQIVNPLMARQIELLKKRLNYYDFQQQKYLAEFRENVVFSFDCTNVYEKLDDINKDIVEFEKKLCELHDQANIFEQQVPEFKQIKLGRKELRLLKNLWDYVNIVTSNLDEWKTTYWNKIDVEGMDQECKRLIRELRQLDKEARTWDLYIHMEEQVRNMMSSLRAVSELQNPAIRDRHWQQLMAETRVKFTMDDKTTLEDLLKLELHKYEEEVKETVDRAVKEMNMEKVLKELHNTWDTLEFGKEVHERTKLNVLKIDEETIETLEENQVQLQSMLDSRYVAYFLGEVTDWQQKLSNADAAINAWFHVQRAWMYLESIFIGSEDIRSQLPEETRRFEKIDKDFKDLLREVSINLNVVKSTNKPRLLDRLEELDRQLSICEKALSDYLETKRLAYPRFYFISSADLLNILSNGNNPEMVCKHLPKLYDSLASLTWKMEGGKATKHANGMIAKDGEEMAIYGTCDCSGKVEIWLNRVTDAMRRTVRHHFGQAVASYDEKPRELWILDHEAQPALCGTQIWWTTEVNMAFARLEEGFENALKDYQKKQIGQLNTLIAILRGELDENDRRKIMTICTIDVHARDVVGKLISIRAESSSSFQWDDKSEDCVANICDASFVYAHEYLGNVPRLVITPLTDRCYITLTQSLHLIMGGAPAGPAGTGKTETTKDLGRTLGQMVYVFNCSEQMDYKSCGNIYKGLAQTGAWGCFDEFNRISVEVLSVVAVQVKYILDGVKSRKKTFLFFGAELDIVHTVGIFITMNPGYAGRTELPENLKTLFRPCAMVVPDFELICEIMLVAEGFQEARLLARKFIALYTLCRELLSKQDHYDWGLRAIKSVLVVAGKLKRDDKERPEDQVLMRALRDFNTPKIVTDDVPVFMGLIGDLFPALDVPRRRYLEFEQTVKLAALDLKMQPEDGFILKVVQLEELFHVRHSVFIVGLAGTGKTEVWKTLNRTYSSQKRKPYYNDLNPKAVTNDELFGVINPATREWKDGLFSMLMREQANMAGDGPKWIVFDGDIDPMWIESLNTVMDDNKVLTLASNERIALTKHMRLLTATPATVSRAGILYINPQDLGWSPFVTSWIETRDHSERANLSILFEKYVPPLLEVTKFKFKKITPLPEICHIETLCHLLDCFLTKENVPPECPKEWYELYFAFACIWAFGSAMFRDQLIDWRNEFSKWWQNEFKTVKFPAGGNVFNYFIEPETKKLVPWTEKVALFALDSDIPLQSALVPTGETTRLRFFLDLLVKKRVPVMLVGGAGCGKSVIMADKLTNLPDTYNVANVPFNFYTTSDTLQKMLEKHLEKKAGRNYGPPGTKLLIYFIDDMNMPEVDTYGTVQPHTLIRQHIDYNHWYDRTKLTLKEIHNTQYVSCMNPTVGSFTIDPRLQRHFAVFAVSFPQAEALTTIYSQILEQHVTDPRTKFNPAVQKFAVPLINAALYLHDKISATFLPTVIKFHYIFNLRDLTNIFQVRLSTREKERFFIFLTLRLYAHEATRVYRDKLVNFEDQRMFDRLLLEALRKNIPELDENELKQPLIYCHFADGIGEPKYAPVKDWTQLVKSLDDALRNYNELVSAMNLVLFEDAVHHVCRINRILEAPRGNALLVGVGGSGKQSLSRLASFVSSLEVFQVQLRKDYSLNELRADLAVLYLKAGVKDIGVTFLMSDSQVAEEKFLVVVNDMLASGEIAELFTDEDADGIVDAVRNEVKQTGAIDTKENCWKFFIERVRTQLRCVLCFSPVGATLRKRARQFPAIVNCTAIDWFQDWPQEALESVSATFLEVLNIFTYCIAHERSSFCSQELEELPAEYRMSASLFMSYVHTSVNHTSEIYLRNERRYNYTTPKSFLEQISLYSKLLTEKTHDLTAMISRLTDGLIKLESCSVQVDELKIVLAAQEIELKKKNEIADKILVEVRAENAKAEAEKTIVSEEEARVAEIKETVSENQRRCDEDLVRAEPAVRQAEAALDTLNKNNLTELKSFGTPPEAVAKVAEAVLVLFSPKGKVPKDRSWKACRVVMGSIDGFLTQLRNYDKENIHPDVVKAIQPYITDKEFDPEFVYSKSQAAAGLCSWVKNIMVFHYINESVKPLRAALAQANFELRTAMDKLNSLRSRLTELQKVLDVLDEKMSVALAAKQKCQDEAEATAFTINLANRLVNGLASENIRWAETVQVLKKSGITLPGNVLLVTAFISYMGCFTRKYRVDLMNLHWLPFLDKLQVPIPRTPDLDPLMSTENATILSNSSRWPLLIDPQLQGIRWIKNKYADDLMVLRLTDKNYLDRIEHGIVNGRVVLLESIVETVDAVLEPILARVLIKRGRAIKVGDKEVYYDPRFHLILQTKLANPHYKPEMQAQTTLINFTVTKDGLEEQLLGAVVKAERPDLEATKAELTTQQNTFKITLKALEDDLLHRLSSAGPDILSDVALVVNLETTKKTASEIEGKAIEAKVTATRIDEARESYRPVASRASLLYFILNDLNKINMLYQFSLKAFSVVFQNAIKFAEPADILGKRVASLIDSVTYLVFTYTSRGLFESDKLIFLCQLTLQILLQTEEIEQVEVDFLLRFPYLPDLTSPVDFLSNVGWGGVKYLSGMENFHNLDRDMDGAARRWKKFVESETPEREKFPQDWKNKTAFQRLCIMRCVRLDRMVYAIRCFVEEKLGNKFIQFRAEPFEKTFQDMCANTPVFFILSPGVDPLKDVEKLGKRLGFTFDAQNFHNVSLGQGQEPVAEETMDISAHNGHWVILQNVHLVRKWLPNLEKKMEQLSEKPHEDYRLYISAEPSPDPHESIIPQGILESAIKITNEPPTGMRANIHKALDNFSQDTLEACGKETEFKAILFALCYYHAAIAERRKFGAQGWNRSYPFNVGDLTISASVLLNYLEGNAKVPWEDLRYLFGEIMYGGHITDDWDRRLCRTYLLEYLQPELVEGEMYLAPGFLLPPSGDYASYHQYVEDYLPAESPVLYGLHPNAEIGFLTSTAENLFKTIWEMQPRDIVDATVGVLSKEDKVKALIEDLLDKLPEQFNMQELMSKVEDRTPFVIVALQECERMNALTNELKRSLGELDLGLKGELTISADMEDLQNHLFFESVPPSWTRYAYPSTLGLSSWLADLLSRITELSNWTADFNLPSSIWLGGFFNPQSFLTAIMQQTARKNEWPLDKMCLHCDVTRKQKEEITAAPREGAYVNGLYVEGARWDATTGFIADSRPKELLSLMPVVFVKAITQDKQETKNVYECPLYRTRTRGPTYIWTFNLKTRDKPTKWTLAGVAILLQI
ncbi:PREDICTED: dynein beta chain, ciliary-like [Dinoponera quadriceps]|uniref:Dynein beta chain, ciliary-like n=1 Tax=Dinoponera quadriceps TaxID=609295 RepID=A0A6P3WYG0_DINQU|nr:PREDICTED: dynein beta chain, ciliary-like [Dinoponera quadriceps]